MASPVNSNSLKRKNVEPHQTRRATSPPVTGCRPIVPMSLVEGDRVLPVRVLMDSGATTAVVSLGFAKHHLLNLVQRANPLKIGDFAGREVEDAGKFYTYPLRLNYQDHWSLLTFEVAPMDHECDVMLPFWWSTVHVPSNFFSSVSQISFDSDYCRNNCTKENCKGFDIEYDPSILFEEQSLNCIAYLKSDAEGKSYLDWQVLANRNKKLSRVNIAGAKADTGDLTKLVPQVYHEYLSVFDSKNADRLPPHRKWDHAIDLEEGKEPPWGPIYALSELELSALREYLDEMLASGKIRPSKSPAGAPILFVPKSKGRGLRLCVDYRGLNNVSVKNRYPLPLMNELRDRVEGSKIFTKIDLKSGFNLIRIRSGDEWKTAFRTRYGHYEYLVMPFGLANAPSSFQNMMNDIFRDLLDRGLVVYMDDLFMYSSSYEDHVQLVAEVLKRLRENNLVAAIDKCQFHQTSVEFLGHVVSVDGIDMEKGKVESIVQWPQPTSLKEMQSFLGLANYYRRFIKDYSKICKPLTDTTKGKSKDWAWTPQCGDAFKYLKARFTSAPILKHFDPKLQTVVETDASDFAVGAVLSQFHDRILHPVAFHSRKMDKAEVNYEVHDKEMLAIVTSFKEWRRYLEGACMPITVYTDHKNLEYFLTTKVLNRRQARWAQELAGYDFKIVYRPGPQNGRADALSRRADYQLSKDGNSLVTEHQPEAHVLKPEHFEHGRIVLYSSRLQMLPKVRFDDMFLDTVRNYGRNDPAYTEEISRCASGNPSRPDAEQVDGVLYVQGRLAIPDSLDLRVQIMESEHDSKVAGHMGMDKTLELIKRNFFWKGMSNQISDFVRSCPICQAVKAPRHGRYGLLHPLELPYAPWQSISMDFIVELPLSEGHSQIWVIVDRFTKMAHFIPLLDNQKTAKTLAKVFVKEIWRLHGLPLDIVSDRDRRFTGDLWTEACNILGIRQRMSTAFQPETDGQTERVNSTIEHYIRCFTNYEQDNWTELLPLAEYAYNNSVTSATGYSPFYANYGFNPRSTWATDEGPRNPGSTHYMHWMISVHSELLQQLKHTREQMGRYYDRNKLQAPAFQPGDLVMLNGKNLKTRRKCKKLDNKLFGPFEIVKVITPMAVRIRLPQSWKIHDVFHVKLLEPYRASAQRPPPKVEEVLIDLSNAITEEFSIKRIRGASYSKSKRRVLYLVEWDGYPDRKDWTEEPFEHFSESGIEDLKDFHLENPAMPRDERVGF